MERLLLRDRAGPQSTAGAEDGVDQDDTAAAAATVAAETVAAGAAETVAGGAPMRRPSFERDGDKEGRRRPVRHPAPKNVKAVCVMRSMRLSELRTILYK